MNYDTYEAGAVQLAVDLANTATDDPEALDEFVATHSDWFVIRSAQPLTTAERTVAADLAARVRAVAAASSDSEVVAQLNGLLDRCDPVPRVTDHDGTLHLHYSGDDAGVVDQLGATVAMGLALLVCRYGRERLGICAADDCAAVFVDTSRNRSRRYCSDTCASRTTVSAYRARRRAAATAR